VLLRACILSENNLIDLDCLPNDMVMQVKDQDRLSDTNGSSFTDEFASANNVSSIENFKKASINRALELTCGNMTQAAKNLKISRSNLYLLVKKYNLK
jgi:DNA-binding NtrC family response regulator